MLSERAATLRAADQRGYSKEELEVRERVRLKIEEENRKKQRVITQQQEANSGSVAQDYFMSEVELTGDSEELVIDDDHDEDWIDIPDPSTERTHDSASGYNTRQLKYFSMEADRYKVSDRAAAKLGNALLKDIGLVKKGYTKDLICPSKIRRERSKWGAKLEKDHLAKSLPQGLYSDGKRVNTLVRDTVVTKVQVPGRRGKSAYREVITTSNKVEKQEHFVVVSEPGGEYCSHVAPENGTGAALAGELVAVVRERGVVLRILGMDGCSVNCGIHIGVFRIVETTLGYAVQHCVCLLHLNELPLRHFFIWIDGTTSGPGYYFQDFYNYSTVLFQTLSKVQ